ncbi:MAG TPA: branched-chain amino acid ABC transporter permease [Desulfobacteraceae bacterium]|nr:branched-chain amino acid ABC transporter permease [Desulfobacteraceae bacterium]
MTNFTQQEKKMQMQTIKGKERPRITPKRVVLTLLIFALMLLLPKIISNEYWLHVIIGTGIVSITVIGLRILMQTGPVSFAQAGFMAVGGYTSALLVMKLGISFWISLFFAGIVAACVGCLLGWPALRLKADYFFLVSFCMGEVIRLFFNFVGVDLFGGPTGLASIPPPDPVLGIEIISKTSFFYLVFLFVCLAMLLSHSIDRSRIATIFSAIKDRDDLAASLGINVIKYKVLAFGISCFLAGISGALYAHYYTCISPTCFTVTQSVNTLAYTVVGGIGSFLGPLLGTAFLRVVGELVRTFGDYEVMVAGVALILVVKGLPKGIISIPSYFRGSRNLNGK